MKKIFLLLAFFSLLGCEKDDICDQDATPNLIIEFYNFENRTELRNVTNLKVLAVGETDSLQTFNAVSKIAIPLKIDADYVKYSFIINSTDTDFANEDFIELNYTRKNVFISRACGYKTVYTLNDIDPIVYSDAVSATNLWIKDIDVQTNNINNENEVHVKIYF